MIVVKDTRSSSNVRRGSEHLSGSVDEEAESKQQHKAHERLGFGYLAMFRTMRYLFIIQSFLAITTLLGGIAYRKFDPVKTPGYSAFDEYSIANIDYSTPRCIQQYSGLDLPRTIDCGSSSGIITSIISSGIISATTKEIRLTTCLPINSEKFLNWTNIQSYACSKEYFDNDTLVEYFNANCANNKNCSINLSGFIKADAPSACKVSPSRVYL